MKANLRLKIAALDTLDARVRGAKPQRGLRVDVKGKGKRCDSRQVARGWAPKDLIRKSGQFVT